MTGNPRTQRWFVIKGDVPGIPVPGADEHEPGCRWRTATTCDCGFVDYRRRLDDPRG